ncbi:MAG TPA: GNAT family protein [Anaerolineaceae bacterium]|nr:GNAT family protein [Anaerolineaceae bacterium]
MDGSLFKGNKILLAALDGETDAQIEATWTHDPDFSQLITADPVRPLYAAQVKKKYEEIAKEEATRYRFGIRTLDEDRLIGFVDLRWIEWTNGSSWLSMGIGKPVDRGHGYGSEALRMLTEYAFDELNLYRISAMVSEYNQRAIHLLETRAFRREVCQREAIHRFGRRWDNYIYELSVQDWKATRERGEAQ